MIRFFKYIPKIIKILYIVSSNQIITHPGNFKNIPTHLKILGIIASLFLYPKGLFVKPKKIFGQRLAKCFCSLGPIYIKFGQTLSTRPDIIGKNVAESLKYLQDKLDPFDSKIAHQYIEENFDMKTNEIFDEFIEKPVAAASIAQVHKARLKSGEIVAVKFLRPNIQKLYASEIVFLEFLTSILVRIIKIAKRFRAVEIIAVFKQAMKYELDLRLEAAAASRIADNFVNDDTLYVPKIYWNLTTENIITLEWVEGVSIYDKEKIIDLKLDPKEIAKNISVIFFNQAYRDGFFHADLHPGNILIRNDGKITLIDFGIVSPLSEHDRLSVAEILYAFLKKDYRLVAEIHLRIGYIPKNTNLDYFAQSCRAVAEPIIGRSTKNISMGNLMSQLFDVVEEFGMQTQPQLLFLQKTMVMVEGIGQTLNEDINMWELADPWIKKWAAKNISPEAKILRAAQKLINQLSIGPF